MHDVNGERHIDLHVFGRVPVNFDEATARDPIHGKQSRVRTAQTLEALLRYILSNNPSVSGEITLK